MIPLYNMSPRTKMSFHHLPEDLILYIWVMIETNKDMVSLVSTCKRFRDLGKKRGCIKSIDFSWNSDYMNFSELCGHPKLFLHQMKISDFVDPIFWIPTKHWTKTMIFERCCMGGKCIDPDGSKTETLVIKDNHRRRNRYTLRINWSKLPKLKVLDLYVHDVDLNGLETCQELEAIRIDVNNNRFFPEFLAKLPQLRFIALSRGLATEKVHFTSPDLKICFVPKKQDFTAVSKTVSKRHLESDFYVNIECHDPRAKY